jgi:hypothetical protein
VHKLLEHVLDEQSEFFWQAVPSHCDIELHDMQRALTHVFDEQSESVVHVDPSQ